MIDIDWKRVAISKETPILKAIEIIDKGFVKIALVVSEDDKLIGTLTDGDVRRGLLKGFSLNDTVEEIMNKDPAFALVSEGEGRTKALMQERQITQIPILDDEHKVVRIDIEDPYLSLSRKDNRVVIMAGGLGQRLGKLTKDTPKPLLKVGSKPILETILESFIAFGFHKFYFSVNYKSEQIKDYFGDGSSRGITIDYLTEETRMGTAGSLSLLPEKITEPMIVMNGDLLTKVNFENLLDFHKEREASATICVRAYDFQVPYGVIKTDGTRIKSIVEKPVHNFFVNAGVYVLDPEILDMVPKADSYDMPSLFEELVSGGKETAVFPIREYWLDIGQKDDFDKANFEYKQQFD